VKARLLRPAVAVAAVAALSVGLLPAEAAPKALVLKDVAGDANALNAQGFGDVVPVPGDNATGPASAASLDILSVSLASTGTDKKVKKGKKTTTVFDCTGFSVTMELAAAPFASAIYRVQGTGVNNATIWWLNYSVSPEGTSSYIQYDGGSGDPLASSTLDVPAKVEGSKITWTVSNAALKGTGEKPGAFSWSALGAHTRTSLVAVVAPEVDSMTPTDDGFFTPCK
jgi:hypothetical protein